MNAADGADRRHLVRLWWAAPLAVVTATGAAFAVVVAPAAANRAAVPRELSVAGAQTSLPSPAPAARRHAAAKKAAHPAPVSTQHALALNTPAPAPVTRPNSTHAPRIIAPSHPVVTEPPDDGGAADAGGSDDGGQTASTASPTPTGYRSGSGSSGGDG